VLLTFPAVERLRQLFPEAKITALVGSWAEPLARGHACIDEVLTYNFFDSSSALPHQLLQEDEKQRIEDWLSRYGFDLTIDFGRCPISCHSSRLGARNQMLVCRKLRPLSGFAGGAARRLRSVFRRCR